MSNKECLESKPWSRISHSVVRRRPSSVSRMLIMIDDKQFLSSIKFQKKHFPLSKRPEVPLSFFTLWSLKKFPHFHKKSIRLLTSGIHLSSELNRNSAEKSILIPSFTFASTSLNQNGHKNSNYISRSYFVFIYLLDSFLLFSSYKNEKLQRFSRENQAEENS